MIFDTLSQTRFKIFRVTDLWNIDPFLWAETQLLRRLPAAYKDGSYEPSGESRPNPIELSDALMNGTTGKPSYRNRTALLVFFGEHICMINDKFMSKYRDYRNIYWLNF